MAARSTLVVFERSGSWAVAIRQALARSAAKAGGAAKASAEAPGANATPCRLVETRTVSDCREALSRTPDALVAIALAPETCDDGLALLAAIADEFPSARAVVLADRKMRSYEWLARELGAAHFACSPRRMDEICAVLGRHAANRPAPARGTAERIWETLPWS